MADSAMVEAALLSMLATAFYPNGTGQPSAVSTPVKLSRGWPTEAGVNEAVTAGYTLVTVHAARGFSVDATRYSRQSFALSVVPPTLAVTINGLSLTISGKVTAGNLISITTKGVIAEPFTTETSAIITDQTNANIYFIEFVPIDTYNYSVQQSDTLTSIASSLANLIPGAISSGPNVTLLVNENTQASVVNGGTAAIEVARVKQGFSIECWSPSPASRDSVFGLLPVATARTYRLTLDDGTVATLITQSETGPDDAPSRMNMFRRDMRVIYDFPIIATSIEQAVSVFEIDITPQNGVTNSIYIV